MKPLNILPRLTAGRRFVPENPLHRATLITIVFLLVSLPFLGRAPLFDPDEGYYPETAREMIERGNWLDPVFNGEGRWGKPVAFYLAECVSFKLFGISEWSARLPSLLAGLGFVLVIMGLGTRLYGPRAGLYAGIVAATAMQPAVYSRAAVPDMLLSLFVALSLYAFVRGGLTDSLEQGPESRYWIYTGWLCSALAFLVKGPLGLILPVITIACYLVLSGRLRKLSSLEIPKGALIFLLAAGPWFIYMAALHGTAFLEETFLQRNLARYFTNKWEHAGPLYYYLPVLFAGAFPWSVAFIWGVWLAVRRVFRRGLDPGQKSSLRDPDLFILCWLAGMLIFFSLSRSKLPNYVLPLYPAVAIFTARCLLEVKKRGSLKDFLILAGSTSLIAVLFYAFAGSIKPERFMLERWSLIVGFSPLLVIAISVSAAFFKNRVALWTGVCSTGMALFLAALTGTVIPRIERFQAVKTLSLEHLAGRLALDERLVTFDAWSPSLLFYTGRLAIRFNPLYDTWASRATGVRWVLTRESALGRLEEVTGAPPAEVYRMGHRVLVRVRENGGR